MPRIECVTLAVVPMKPEGNRRKIASQQDLEDIVNGIAGLSKRVTCVSINGDIFLQVMAFREHSWKPARVAMAIDSRLRYYGCAAYIETRCVEWVLETEIDATDAMAAYGGYSSGKQVNVPARNSRW